MGCLGMAPEPHIAPSMTTHVNTVTDGITRVFTWEEDARIEVRDLGGEIVIEANAAGLRTLAGHLITLAQDGTQRTRRGVREPGPGEVRRRMTRARGVPGRAGKHGEQRVLIRRHRELQQPLAAGQ